VGALGHYLEAEGLATTQISLIYEHTAAIQPPRALWVPFELGRPLGVPNDPEFQKRVLKMTLDLLAESSGPVLASYPEKAPEVSGPTNAWVCPIILAPPPSEEVQDKLLSQVLSEIGELAPWYDLGRRRRGRTLFGVSGLTIDECARFLASLTAADQPAGVTVPVAITAGHSLGETLKRASEDLFAWYTEAAAAQPGDTSPTRQALEDWFWGETAAGRLKLDLARHRTKHPDPLVRRVIERNLVPWTQTHRLETMN